MALQLIIYLCNYFLNYTDKGLWVDAVRSCIDMTDAIQINWKTSQLTTKVRYSSSLQLNIKYTSVHSMPLRTVYNMHCVFGLK